MNKHKQLLQQYIEELTILKKDENFLDKVFHLDGSPNSPYLQLYSKIVKKYFNIKNTEEIKDFNWIKHKSFERIKLLYKTPAKIEKIKEKYEDKFKEHEDKFLLDTIILEKKKYSMLEYEEMIKKIDDIIIEYTEEEKEIIINLFKYINKLTKEEKEIIELEIKYILLTEYIYLNKFDKLIKKIIHKNTKNRYLSSSVSGTIATSDQESNLLAKNNKDDLLNLIKKEAFSYALEGFLIGIRRYDIEMGNQLITYMSWWLEQKVIDYIEKDSSLNKATKKNNNLKNYNFQDAEKEEFMFHKYDNIKYSNFNFHDITSMSNSIIEKEEKFFNNTQQEVVKDILLFFCKYKDIFMYHEYLLIKYDILLENFIYFIEIEKEESIKECFYRDINIFVNKIQKEKEYKDVKNFTEIKEFYKISELLENYFNVEHSEFLSIKRTLKQKFVNMLNKIFTNTEKK